MPATSKSQQSAAAIALHGDKEDLKGASKEMRAGMSDKQLRHFAKTKRTGLPKKVEESFEARLHDALFGVLTELRTPLPITADEQAWVLYFRDPSHHDEIKDVNNHLRDLLSQTTDDRKQRAIKNKLEALGTVRREIRAKQKKERQLGRRSRL